MKHYSVIRKAVYIAFLIALALACLGGLSSSNVHAQEAASTSREVRRISVSTVGTQGNNSSWNPAISADGRYVAFESAASNFFPNDTNHWYDVFVRDLMTETTTVVSVDSNGVLGNQLSHDPSISADGRYVAFSSPASNLVPGDTNGWEDVFVHDMQTGTTVRVSVNSSGAQGTSGSSNKPSISGNGRYVVFSSTAMGLVSGDTSDFGDIFRHDLQTGETIRVSVDSTGVQSNQGADDPSISADGRLVVFDSYSSNLVANDTNDVQDI
jgi:Tol biopolymer transport system component